MAFVMDVQAHRTVGWQVSALMTTDVVLDALDRALSARQPSCDGAI